MWYHPPHSNEVDVMKYGARNKITAKVVSVKSDDIMSLARFEILSIKEMSSVLQPSRSRKWDLNQATKSN